MLRKPVIVLGGVLTSSSRFLVVSLPVLVGFLVVSLPVLASSWLCVLTF